MNADLLVVGAGVAGLTAARLAAEAGLRVILLEARQRAGGRIHTIRDPHRGAPIELGAEFVHGLPEEIWMPCRQTGISMIESEGGNGCP